MTYDEYTQIRVDSLLEKYFEGERRMSEVKVKLTSLNLPPSDVEDLVNSTRDAKRDIMKGR